ncbi:hypothetical protein [Acinetobacter sp. YH12233]|uniref:hypothetical protein n=1 Tax=Acinetobacter sp. YH12233 TaxID=2601161 RepID=UPI0015D2300D|nr:hypothetical protein [Acinetobacter sp. YH12233]
MNTKVDEGKLISGKEALIALANGESVQKRSDSWAGDHWLDISRKELFNLECFLSGLNRNGETIKFRLKPRTIKINEIEVPAPFKPEDGDKYYYIDSNRKICYDWDNNDCETTDENRVAFGAWRTEEEIKQVVAALRQVFGGSHDN